MSASRHVVFSLLFAVLAASALFGACGPTTPPCARIKCDRPKQCNPTSGVCELPAGYDGGAGGGTAADAGLACEPGCTGATPVCDTATGRCVQCLTAAQCACPTPLCSANVCQPDAEDAGVIVPSDTCATAPTALACGPKTFDVSVNLFSTNTNVQTACAAPDAGGGDVVFNVLLGVASDVRVTVSPGPGGAQPVAALRTQCSTDVDLACVDSGGLVASFRARRLQPGPYSFVLQGYDRSGSGPTLAKVEVLPPTGSTNETCLQAQPLALDGGTNRVDLIDADDDVQLSCNPTPRSPDLFYRFTLPQASDVIINAVGSGPQLPVMALWTGRACRLPPVQPACSTSTSPTGRLIARRLNAGDYTLVVETPGPVTLGRLELSATAGPASVPPSNDTCALPRDLVFPAGLNETSASVDTSLGTDASAATCGGAGSPDQVFRLSVTTTGTYTFTATPEAGSGGAPVLSLRKATCDAMTVEQCAAAPALDQAATFTATLAPDTYYLWLDSTQPATAGRVTLTVRR
ncbi:MAG: hypothetical protein Q8S33_20700 [Myxococcales bacterium]|nr:hypothetical protein [Myxococcales bacterium]